MLQVQDQISRQFKFTIHDDFALLRDRGGFKTLYEALWYQAVHVSLVFYKIALFQITNGANSRLYRSKTLKKYHSFVSFQNGRQEVTLHTETADQIHRLISFPVPLELRFGETTISSKFFLRQFPPNFFPLTQFFSFWRGQGKKLVFFFAVTGGWKVTWKDKLQFTLTRFPDYQIHHQLPYDEINIPCHCL